MLEPSQAMGHGHAFVSRYEKTFADRLVRSGPPPRQNIPRQTWVMYLWPYVEEYGLDANNNIDAHFYNPPGTIRFTFDGLTGKQVAILNCPSDAEPATWRGEELLAALGGGGAHFFDALLPSGVGGQTAPTTWPRSGTWSGPNWSPGRPRRVRARVSGGAHRQARRPAARTHRARLAAVGWAGCPGCRGCPHRRRRDAGHWWSAAARCRRRPGWPATSPPCRPVRRADPGQRADRTPRGGSGRPTGH